MTCNYTSPHPIIRGHELTTHIQGQVDAEVAKSDHAEKRNDCCCERIPVGGMAEVYCGRVPVDQPHDTREKYQKRSKHDEPKNQVNHRLYSAMSLQSNKTGQYNNPH